MGLRALRPARFACLAIAGLAVFPVGAETAYVTDKLRLTVHRAEDTSDEAFTSLNSGDQVEILERNRAYVRVRLPDGRTGWVRGAYLLDQEPAVRRVEKLEAERDRLAGELEKLRKDTPDRSAEISELRKSLRDAQNSAAGASKELQRQAAEAAELRARIASRVPLFSLLWIFGAATALFLLGACAAWWWFDRRSRRRHGGFRIY